MDYKDHRKINNSDVAIIGIGLRVPDSSTPDEFWNNLISKKDSISKITSERWNNDYFKYFDQSENGGFIDFKEWKNFDNEFFGITASEAEILDPQTRLLLKCAYETFEDAKKLNSHRGTKTSVFIGSHLNEYQEINSNDCTLGSYHPFVANHLSYVFDLRGQSAVVNTACSSSFDCINLGYQSIVNGNCEMSLSGGVNTIFNNSFSTKINVGGALSKTGRCHTFEAEADGYCRGEGVGLVLMKKYSEAIKDGDNIYCVIRACNTNCDGGIDKVTRTMPSAKGQSDNIKQALASIKMHESEIFYVEPHGTGTPIGDPIEIQGISNVFRESHQETPLYMGSLKPNIGHLESASGASALIKVALMLKNRKICPMLSFKNPNPDIPFEDWKIKIVTEEMDFPTNKKINIGINNFGIGGTNTFMIVSEKDSFNYEVNSPPNEILNTKESDYLIPISSNSVKSIELYKKKLLDLIDGYSQTIDFELFLKEQFQKFNFFQRSVVIASNWSDLKSMKQISSSNTKQYSTFLTQYNTPVVFVFCGQGPQYRQMGIQLYNESEIFKSKIDTCDENLKKYFGYSIWEKLINLDDSNVSLINEPLLAQPSIFLIQYGLFEFYKYWGVKINAVIGHSFGEVTAAYASSMISLDVACKTIYYRALLQNKTIGMGRMLSIGLNEQEFKNKYSNKEWFTDVEIACYNSNDSIVISSSESILNDIQNDLKTQDIFATMLSSICPFHTSKQEFIKNDVLSIDIPKSLSPSIPFYSTVTSNLWDNSLQYNPQYIYDNIRKPVLFEQTINNLLKNQNIISNKNVIFVEVSPHPTLSHYIKNSKFNITIINPLHKKKDNTETFNNSIASIYISGGNVDFSCQLKKNFNYTFNSLPRYCWDDRELWIEDKNMSQLRKNGVPTDSLGFRKSGDGNITFETTIDIRKNAFNYLIDHKIGNEIYYPGCGYIYSILKYYKDKSILISYFLFTVPLIFNETSVVDIQMIITKLSKTEDKVQFMKKEHGKDDVYREVGYAKVLTILFDQNKYISNLEEIENQCNIIKLEKNQLYKHIKHNVGLNYGPRFQRVQEIKVGNIYSIYKVSIKDRDSIFDKEFFSPSILDNTLHNGFFQNDSSFSNCVFDRIENLYVYYKNIPSNDQRDEIGHLNVISKYLGRVNKSFKFEIQCFLDSGLLLFKATIILTNSMETKNKISITQPTSLLTTSEWQLKESPLNPPNSFIKNIGEKLEYYYETDELKKYVSIFWFKEIKKRNGDLTIDQINQFSIKDLSKIYLIKNSTIHEQRLFNKIFKLLKQYNQYLGDELNEDKIYLKNSPYADEAIVVLNTNIKYQVIQCIGSNNEENFEKFNILNNSEILYKIGPSYLTQSICTTIKDMLLPLLYTKTTFKIIEFGGGSGGLTSSVAKTINNLLNQYDGYLVDIEYTFSDVSPAFIESAKQFLNPYKNFKITYKTLDLEKDLLKQDVNPITYDLVLMQFVLHAVKDINYSIEQVYNIMNPNSHLILVEPSKDDFFLDCLYSNFYQWNNYNDSIRTDHCCLNVSEWLSFLLSKGFSKEITCSKNDDSNIEAFFIHCQKPRLFVNIPNNYLKDDIKIYDNVIIYPSNNIINMDIINDHYLKVSKNQISYINESKNIENIIKDMDICKNSNNLIVFGKGLDSLNEENFEHYCMELTILLQFILNGNFNNFKLILFTFNSQMESTNYINSSLFGVLRYFFIHEEVKCYSFDFDNVSFKNKISFENIEIILKNSLCERYFSIRNNQFLIEKVHKEFNNRFKSDSFVKDKLIARLNQKLECDFIEIPSKLPDDAILVKVMATGVNFKDMLYYLGQILNSTMGLEYSGIVEKVGNKVTNFKVGDMVYGPCDHGISSYIFTNSNCCFLKPPHLSFEEAASIPIVFSTSYYSLFEAHKIKDGDSILIHSATGGVGLSALNLLKWKNFKGLIFVTVGSKEKEEYIRGKYGDFVTEIYSTKDMEYSIKIPEYLQNYGKDGVDVILNTLSGEYMSANFSCLNVGGKIVDLSVTHILKNDLMDYKSMGLHHSYVNVDLSLNKLLIPSYFKEIANNIYNNEIEMIPIKSYPIERIEDLFTEMRNRKHIGKLIVNYGDKSFFDDSIVKNYYKYNIIAENYKIKSDSIGSTILITGQRGLALHTIKWILKFGDEKIVKDIIILSRSEIDWELQYTINKYILNGGKINFHFKNTDVSKYQDIKSSIQQVYSENNEIQPVDSIFHYAFQLSDAMTNKTTLKNLEEAHSGKSHGAINLHNLSIELNWNLKTFLLNSSMVSLIGSEFQLSYISANTLVDSLNRYRRSIGLSSVCIRWGALDSSYITRNSESISNIDFNSLLSVDQMLGGIDLMLQNQDKYNELFIGYFDQRLCKTQNYQNHFDNAFKIDKRTKNTQSDLSIKDNIVLKISSLLQIDSQKVNCDMKLSDYGADSLLMIQFKNWLEMEYLPITLEKLQNSNINNIIEFISDSNK